MVATVQPHTAMARRARHSTDIRLTEQHVVASDENGDFVGSCIAWEGEPVEKTADDALRADGNKEQTAKADAVRPSGQSGADARQQRERRDQEFLISLPRLGRGYAG
jgi:hypothetical protein